MYSIKVEVSPVSLSNPYPNILTKISTWIRSLIYIKLTSPSNERTDGSYYENVNGLDSEISCNRHDDNAQILLYKLHGHNIIQIEY